MARLAAIGLLWLLVAVAALFAAGLVLTRIGAARIASAFPPVGRFVEIDGGRLHYLDRPGANADAPVLLMIHGASSNHAELPLALEGALGRRFRLISVDRPGHGWSDRIGGDEARSPARQAAIVAAAVQKIGAARVIVVAHSLAGAMAMQLALNHRDLVAGLVLIAPATHAWPGGITWYYTPASHPLIGPVFANTLSLPLGWLGVNAGIASAFAPQSPPESYLERAKIPLVLRPANFIANAKDVAALKAFVTAQSPRYATLKIPVAIVSGDSDDIVSTSIHSAALSREIAGAELTVLPGVGHAPHHHAPAVVAAAIERVATRAGLLRAP